MILYEIEHINLKALRGPSPSSLLGLYLVTCLALRILRGLKAFKA
ncbi:unnamed protein product [Penicillium camemberti]|uniref:Str. FM013 n=1 Tax=Penicillium camemberti (strain FM 013) TaxID=1429867 RepID=A0A0G4NWG0_PENC3|nr:unnamed protein product [Penicillium camemberti]